MTTIEVIDNPGASRFEMSVDGYLCLIDYRRSGSVLNLTHTEVPAALSGRGLAAQLVTGALNIIHSRHEKLIPTCPYVAAFLKKHPEYQDLVA